MIFFFKDFLKYHLLSSAKAGSSQLLLSNNDDMLRLIRWALNTLSRERLAKGNWLANCGLQSSPDGECLGGKKGAGAAGNALQIAFVVQIHLSKIEGK